MTEENVEVEVETGPKKAKRVIGITKEAVITVITEDNPKREGSQAYERFDNYFQLGEGATVQDALDAGLTIGDVRYDFIHGSIEVEGAEVEEYEITPRGEVSEADATDAAADAGDVDTDSDDSGF